MSKSKYKVGDIVENRRDRQHCGYLLTNSNYVIAYVEELGWLDE